MGGLSVLGAAALVVGVVAFVASDSEPSGGTAENGAQWGVDLPDQDAFDGSQAPGITCLPAGCEVWTVGAPVEGRPLVDELVVVVGDEEMVAYETSTGETRWRVPTPAGAERLGRRLVALSAQGLALLPDGQEAGSSQSRSSVGSGQLDLYDVADGSHRGHLDLELDEAGSVSWYGDRLVIAGTRAGQPTVVGVTPDGRVVWEHQGRETLLRSQGHDVLLETDGSDVIGVEPATGEQRWRTRGVPAFPDGTATDTVLVLDPEGDEAQLIDVEQGTIEQTFPAEGATLARRMGPWVATGNAELIRVHDADTGEELSRHEFPAPDDAGDLEAARPLTLVSWQQVGDLMVVAWPPDPDQDHGRVVVYSRDGQPVRSIDIEVHAYPAIWLEAVDPQEATVFASAFGTDHAQGGGRTVYAVDVHEGQAEEVGQGIIDQVDQYDEMVTVRNDNGVRVLGPAGEIDVVGGRRLAAPRPLIAYGPEGLMRLDPGILGFAEPRDS